jgi:hypothetical protein
MKGLFIRTLACAAIYASIGVPSHAQSVKDVAGTYVLVSETRETNGTKTDVPTKGSLSLDASGRYIFTTIRPDLPKVASGIRTTATPEENKAIVSGALVHFGTFTVSENNLIFNVQLASFPNWNGIEQKRAFTLNGDELKYTLANASGGGAVTLTWRRMR